VGHPHPVLHPLTGPLLGLSLCLLEGAVLGFVVALLLRRGGLAWSWAPVLATPVAGPLALASLLDPTIALPGALLLAAALATASGFGLDAHLEDLRIGGDRESAARARRRPLDRARARLSERRGRRRGLLGDQVPLGRTAAGELVAISRGDARSGRHVLVPGATGAGKTTTLGALLVDHVVRARHGAVVIEAKNDAALLDAARSAARARGARFHLFSPEGPSIYDPLAHGSVDERSERLIAVEDWGSADADFYRQAASPFLRLVIRVLDAGSTPTTLAAVAAACSPDALANAAAAAGDPGLLEESRDLVTAMQPDQARAVGGMRARLANLASSELARSWLDPAREGPAFELRSAIAAREVAYFRFDTDRTGNVGRAVAQMALLDLGAAASDLMDRGVGTFVCVDEFGALEASALERLFVRGRSAGFSVALGTQTLADLSAAGPAVRERIGATVSAILCHRIGEQADAEWIAGLIGTVPTWQTTIRTEGPFRHTKEGTRTRGYRFEVNPSELQRLASGEAWVARLDRSDPARARRVRVVPAWVRLGTATR
jgi:Type IV secretion-system coupling protein DNA-binding domain